MDIAKEPEKDEHLVLTRNFRAASPVSTALQQLTVTAAPTMNCTSNQLAPSHAADTPSKTTTTTPVKVPTPSSSPLPMRRISCADQFASRQQQFNSNRASYPRATGRQYFIRDRQEDLMANLLSLRDLLLNQNVPV